MLRATFAFLTVVGLSHSGFAAEPAPPGAPRVLDVWSGAPPGGAAVKVEAANVPVEMHIFSAGGHGFGVRLAAGKPVEAWPDLLVRWGRHHGFFGAK